MVFDSMSVSELNLEDPVYRKKRRLKTEAQVNATLSNYTEEELPEWISRNQDTTRRTWRDFHKWEGVSHVKSCCGIELDEDRWFPLGFDKVWGTSDI